MPTTPTIPPLRGGGLILGYRCTSQCQHCLYASSPNRDDGLSPDESALSSLLDELARRAPQAAFHIGGGEPVLHRSLLKHAIAGMKERRLVLSYVETNCFWATSRERARTILADLAAAGLRCLLISISPFHAASIPLAHTLIAIEAAEAVLAEGAFPWQSQFLTDLQPYETEQPIDFEAFISDRGPRYARELTRRYGLIPSGRTGHFLCQHGAGRPWQTLVDEAPCQHRLVDTGHFHVDGDGNYVPGLCSGLVLPLASVPGPISAEQFPLLHGLATQGLSSLLEVARQQDFSPRDRYASACDLCTHIRLYLHELRPDRYQEIGPPGFYDELRKQGCYQGPW